MKKFFAVCLTVLALAGAAGAEDDPMNQRLFRVADATYTTLGKAVGDLKTQKFILVGEHHGQESHHRTQLMVLKALFETGARVAVGLEMFRSDSQNSLDRWAAGDMSDRDFQAVYYDNWNFAWPFYSAIFEFAKANHIPLIGLNVPREITRQVARQGFSSLSDEQKRKIPPVVCRVDQEYMDFIKKAFGAHAHGQLDFNNFCEAQLVWDNVMAVHALDFIQANPQHVMIILTGVGHAWKRGIPDQIRQRSSLPVSVIMPEIPDHIEPGLVGHDEADYILLDRHTRDQRS